MCGITMAVPNLTFSILQDAESPRSSVFVDHLPTFSFVPAVSSTATGKQATSNNLKLIFYFLLNSFLAVSVP